MNRKKRVSVVIRTLNEGRYLAELLDAIYSQQSDSYSIEVVVVDSGSTDETRDIANSYKARIINIERNEFTFGRSLNLGCQAAEGEYMVFVSGHCVPANLTWLHNLVAPLEGVCHYTYGRQLGRDTTKFSERQLFDKYFPAVSRIPQEGFFCNNANAAIRREVWEVYRFDETLTGCEDMCLAKTICSNGGLIGYVADAPVYHIHDETWERVQIRYEREALALQKILPEVKVTLLDAILYIFVGVVKDLRAALALGRARREIVSIIRFRSAQYIGAYKGNRSLRHESKILKERYFYPRNLPMDIEK